MTEQQWDAVKTALTVLLDDVHCACESIDGIPTHTCNPCYAKEQLDDVGRNPEDD